MEKPYFHQHFYHTTTKEDEKIGMTLPCVGHYKSLTHQVIGRTMNEFQMIYITKGSGWCDTAGERTLVKEGEIFFVFPGIKHSYGCDLKTGWDIWWVHFTGDYAERLMDYAGFSITRRQDLVGKSPSLLRRCKKIFNLFEQKNFHFYIDAAMEFAGLLTSLKTIASHGKMRHPSILDMMDFKASDIDALAQKAGYSKYHFIRKFKEVTGSSPWKYLLLKRIDKAKELLAGGRMSIREISFAIGFEDPDYFSKLFHRRVGLTPLQFRKQTAGASAFI
jgi:AraC-like DNA-binding protein